MANNAISMKDILEGALIGTFNAKSGWGIYIGKEPTVPPQTITIFEVGGRDPNPKWQIDYPSLQVRVRGAKGDYVGAYNKASDVKKALLGLYSQDVNGDRWVSVVMSGDIIFLGYDENNYPRFTLNFNLILEPDLIGGHRSPLSEVLVQMVTMEGDNFLSVDGDDINGIG